MPLGDAAAAPAPAVTAYVALGSNLGDRAAHLREAAGRLGRTAGVELLAMSSFLDNPSVGGPADAPPYLNAAAAVRTTLSPRALLGRLLEIEGEMGRVRTVKNAPRPIDLDVLLYGAAVVHEEGLSVPHPLMHARLFVLAPLAEIAPDALDPARGKTVAAMLAELRGE